MGVSVCSATAGGGPASCGFEGPKAINSGVRRSAPTVAIEGEANLVTAPIRVVVVAEALRLWTQPGVQKGGLSLQLR